MGAGEVEDARDLAKLEVADTFGFRSPNPMPEIDVSCAASTPGCGYHPPTEDNQDASSRP